MTIKNDFDPECITYSQMNLIFNSRIYYRRLATWTRAYILGRYFGVGTIEELFGRLYFETLDLGNMLQIIHGREDADRYSRLLSQFAVTLRDLLDAQSAGNMEEVERNVNRLYQIALERAAFIQVMNPYASRAEYEDLFEIYIQYVIEIANALAAGDYSREIELFDRLTMHTDIMGDGFAEGIFNFITSAPLLSDNQQQAENVECITYDEMNAIFGIRMFWFEFVTWIRTYMISRYSGLGNVDEVKVRLMRVPAEYVNAMKQIFGDLVAEDYIELFYTYIDLMDAFITAQMEGNIDEINRVTRLLYQNADERAAFIASINPDFWSEAEWRTRLYNNLRSTIDESTSFLTGDYGRNIDIFARLLDQAESTSNYFAQGLFHYLKLYD